MNVSVIIPTYNRSRLLRETIQALVNQQTVEGLTYEVIFVNNGSSDDSETILCEAEANFPNKIRHFHIAPTGGPSAPRNVGIRHARGDVIIILDDDVLADGDLVFRHAEFHQAHPESHHAAVGELYVPEELLADPMSVFHSFPYDEVRKLDRLSYLHFWSCNVSLKRQFMLEAGMFDEGFLYYEDVLCGHQLASHGMHLHFLPTARGKHLHQLKASGVPAKGLFTGLWLYALLQRIPDKAAKIRFGVLSRDLPLVVLVRRLFKRMAFHVVDSPLGMGLLRVLGSEGEKRNRLTDVYYYIIFRRNMVKGFYEAQRRSRETRFNPSDTKSQWVDRGES